MNTIEITDLERQVLGQILNSALANLDVEIRRTDHLEFKESLKQRRVVLNKISEKLENLAVFSE